MKLKQILLAGIVLLPWPGFASEPIPPKGIVPVDGRLAPPLVLTDLDGEPFDLRAQRGRWVFVHFWASWCGPCRREMPAIQRLLEKPPPSLRFAIVNTAEDEDTVFTFLAALAPEVTPLLDRDGQATEAWQPRGLPSTYLVDPQGRIRYRALGGRLWDEPAYLGFLSGLPVAR